MTADADELIDMPKDFENIREYCSALDSLGKTLFHRYVTGYVAKYL